VSFKETEGMDRETTVKCVSAEHLPA